MKRALFPAFTAFFVFSYFIGAQAVPDCPRAGRQPACKGECGQFIDRNGDGICDTWEEEAQKAARQFQRKPSAPNDAAAPAAGIVFPAAPKAPFVAVLEFSSSPAAGAVKSPSPKEPESFYEKLEKFSLMPVLSAVLLLVILSEILKAKIPKYLLFHRDIWNWLLFLSFFSCALGGIFLYFGFFPEYKNFLFRLHLWGGFISFIAGSYHFLERYRCMTPFKKCL